MSVSTKEERICLGARAATVRSPARDREVATRK